ncbi:hypothetical protein SAMN04488003_11181 [Loktanella fryxellensis]|uniref:Uncharacterized protein n=1 Tax=Loktanella fryxellensis TaxID=245187 RepID=A0A1H8EU31_9RHOB|nr:hypothetical protein [Loktanella fryxellensis]SEN22258.1 hypothetical protein SAMN04488003_11181 [Loktanella fryxellensis]
MFRHLPFALLLAACAPVMAAAPGELTLAPTGYRDADDPCRLAYETAATNRYLDDAADLVACPAGPDADAFGAKTNGRTVADMAGYRLFSVPRR